MGAMLNDLLGRLGTVYAGTSLTDICYAPFQARGPDNAGSHAPRGRLPRHSRSQLGLPPPMHPPRLPPAPGLPVGRTLLRLHGASVRPELHAAGLRQVRPPGGGARRITHSTVPPKKYGCVSFNGTVLKEVSRRPPRQTSAETTHSHLIVRPSPTPADLSPPYRGSSRTP